MRFLSRSYLLIVVLASLVLAAIPAATAAVNPASGSGVTVTRVFTGWKEGASFKRIAEYFTGKENTGGIVVLRTHEEQRSGFYFFIRMKNPASPEPMKVNVEVVTPTDKQTKNFSFATELKNGTNLFDLGLTGDDWLDAKANPVAWKIDFVSADGRVLASERSYLWENPPANSSTQVSRDTMGSDWKVLPGWTPSAAVLGETLDGGQSFRWNRSDETWIGLWSESAVEIRPNRDFGRQR